jgi:anti-sigma B factor antagonist
LTRVCIDAKIVTSLTSPTSAVKWNLAEGILVDLDIKENGNVCTLKLKGKLVSGEPVSQFEGAFLNALSSGHVFLILDLEDVPFVDSSGIGSIVNALRTSSKVGGGVKLVKPANFVHKTLKMVGVLDLFEVFDSEKDAAATCAGS